MAKENIKIEHHKKLLTLTCNLIYNSEMALLVAIYLYTTKYKKQK